MKTIRMKCEKCGFVEATNKLNDSRMYCPMCDKNLGIPNSMAYEIKAKELKHEKTL